MKKSLVIMAFFAFSFFLNISFAQKSNLSMGNYDISVLTEPAKEGVFVQAVFARSAKDEKPLGFWYSDAMLELKDAASQKTFATISTNELVNGKSVAVERETQTIYTVGSGGNKFELMIESAMKDDSGMPLGKFLAVSFKVKGISAAKINAVLKMKTDGKAEKLGASSIVSNRIVKGLVGYPAIVLTAVKPVRITVSKRQKKEPFQDIAFETSNVPLSATEWTNVFMLDVSGSTVDNTEKSVAQANHIVNHIIAKEAEPEFVMFHRTSSATTSPGDTITYTISYINIGSGAAKDAEISDPIPNGVTYLEGSAAGNNAEVSIDRKETVGNQAGEATLIRWKITKAILPGESGSVSMRAVVR
jgi:uncharacterized repeat protein (TIGR01451 family)